MYDFMFIFYWLVAMCWLLVRLYSHFVWYFVCYFVLVDEWKYINKLANFKL